MTYNYQYIEKLLLQTLDFMFLFSEAEKDEVREFIDVGEYGLALETLVDIVSEENKLISHEALLLIYRVIDAMNLDRRPFEVKLGDL